MIESLLQIVAFLLPLIIQGVQAVRENQSGANHAANIQNFRKTLAKDNPVDRSALLADQHDRVRLATGGSGRRG
jgi:uncharacterized membrane protein affecting hemolysin expression